MTKVSACADCATVIIGDRQRCPACHDRQAGVQEDAAEDEQRDHHPRSAWQILLAWVIGLQVIVGTLALLVLAWRRC